MTKLFNHLTDSRAKLRIVGKASNYLVIAKYMLPLEVATFGFAQTFARTIRRYMPATLLSDMIRPVFMARFAKTRD